MPAGAIPAVTVVSFSPLVNFRHAGGGRGPRWPRRRLPGGRHQCQKHSGFARKLIPQCGWAREWALARGAAVLAAVGRAESREAAEQVSEFQLSHLPAV